MADQDAPTDKIHCRIDYEDSYVQPLIQSAMTSRLGSHSIPITSLSPDNLPSGARVLQWKQYESLDLDRAMTHPDTNMINSYIIRKALIRKHYLSNTVSHWASKHPESTLPKHMQPGVEFELDFAEFLDDALVEAWELREAFERNEALDAKDREWWILKPGMSDRGQGIRLFSTEDELTAIFEAWDPPSDDEDEDDEAAHSCDENEPQAQQQQKDDDNRDSGIITSQLRHFIAQPYIHPPLLLTSPTFPSANRKFHIRVYVLAGGALRVHVYKPMLALFAGEAYTPPWESASGDPNDELSGHLTNTCMQSGEREGSVHAFWALPDDVPGLAKDWKQSVFAHICRVTGEVFEAAARGMMVHFQPLPNAFEVFGVDFLVDAQGLPSLLEVNAFPDFAQTGSDLNHVIEGLFEEVVDVAVKPFFGLASADADAESTRMVKVLDIDLGRR
ncbi:hypothetical protein AAFC00_001468 [Neodothiora populina]|uniref:Tubulin-tyrosine ligase n=1 Tax=Neodothiora populina TaxID=2781224 RepID=A0ABR3PNZ3_9PEZI